MIEINWPADTVARLRYNGRMAYLAFVTSRYLPRFTDGGHRLVVVLALLLSGALAACSFAPRHQRSAADLAPLHLPQQTLSVAAVAQQVETPDLLATDEAMRDFVALYTDGVRNEKQRLNMLHRAIVGRGSLGMEYDPLADGDARDVFHRGSANCLSYASLFVALAREANLNASYQWLEMRPQWTRLGERVMVRLHVNVSVKLRNGDEYMVDIDPLPSRDIAGSRKITDREAQALYHSNIAMEALAQEDVAAAWLQTVRALQFSPKTPHLWTNLGAIYRAAGQHAEAESSYLYALQLDPWDRSAMNNLVVLYALEGREAEGRDWQRRVAIYRDANPYYHAWLGDQAAEQDNWSLALSQYERALELLPDDSSLLYATGMIHYQLDELQQASGYLQRAIATATLRSDIDSYELQLEEVQREMLVGI